MRVIEFRQTVNAPVISDDLSYLRVDCLNLFRSEELVEFMKEPFLHVRPEAAHGQGGNDIGCRAARHRHEKLRFERVAAYPQLLDRHETDLRMVSTELLEHAARHLEKRVVIVLQRNVPKTKCRPVISLDLNGWRQRAEKQRENRPTEKPVRLHLSRPRVVIRQDEVWVVRTKGPFKLWHGSERQPTRATPCFENW